MPICEQIKETINVQTEHQHDYYNIATQQWQTACTQDHEHNTQCALIAFCCF